MENATTAIFDSNINNTTDVTLFNVTPEIMEPEKPETHGCKLYKFVISFWINGLLCLFGVGGNSLSMIVLHKLKRRSREVSSATILMMALLVTDVLVLVSLAAMKSVPALCAFTGVCTGFFKIYPYYLIWGWPVATTAHALATWMTMLLTIHRYIAVCYPHKSALWGKPNQVILHIGLIAIFTLAFELPVFLNDYIEERMDLDTNSTKLYWVMRDFGHSQGYRLVYKIILYYLVIYAIPLCTISCLTFFLIRTIRRSSKFRQQMSQKKEKNETHSKKTNKEDDLNIILLSIVFLYLFTQAWEPIRRIIEEIDGDRTPKCGEFRYYFDEIPTLMAIISSAMNFVIYCASGKRIRHILKGMFWCCFGRGSRGSETGLSTSSMTGSTHIRMSETQNTSVSMVVIKDV